jgi:hypothetical protein
MAHKMKVAGPVVNGEPDIIHDDDFEPELSGDDNTEWPEYEPDPGEGLC